MTAQILHLIKGGNQTIEIFLNDKDEIYFGEVGDINENPCLFCTTISLDEWKDIKRFIDKQFKSI
jgi:hypothetical protein